MELITLNDARSRIQDIDELVKQGEFSSRAEVYRTGALLLLMSPATRKLVRKLELDTTLFEKHVKNCLSRIKNLDIKSVQTELDFIKSGMMIRELLTSVLGQEKEKEAYQAFREGLTQYSTALSRFEELKEEEKKVLFSSIANEITALGNYIDERKATNK